MSNCIADSKSTALDVRILQVAEWIMGEAEKCFFRDGPIYRDAVRNGETLRNIAAELRAKALTPTAAAIHELFAGASTDEDLADAWRDVAPSLPGLTDRERIGVTEAWITRMVVVSMDDRR